MLLYVHIPFCESKCPYCAFGSVVGKRNLTSAYFDAMIADFREQILKFDVKNGEIETVFIGGGTPSAVDEGYLLEGPPGGGAAGERKRRALSVWGSAFSEAESPG